MTLFDDPGTYKALHLVCVCDPFWLFSAGEVYVPRIIAGAVRRPVAIASFGEKLFSFHYIVFINSVQI